MTMMVVVGTALAILLGILESEYTYYAALRYILSFDPVFAASYAFFRLIAAMYIDGTCNQCGEDCTRKYQNCNSSVSFPIKFTKSNLNRKLTVDKIG